MIRVGVGFMKKFVFVYGTLRSNLRNNYLLKDAEMVSNKCWAEGTLYDVGCGYPAMAVHPKKRVYGELYQVTEHELKQLDRLEGYEKNGTNNHYERIEQTIFTAQCPYTAYVYIYKKEQVSQLEEVPLGDWKDYVLSKLKDQ
jgi:gamma-glutamylcyclotransferase (GGCT)/AIG2-like uncharacterized protein YtfP